VQQQGGAPTLAAALVPDHVCTTQIAAIQPIAPCPVRRRCPPLATRTVPEGCASCRARPAMTNVTASNAAMQRIAVRILVSPWLQALGAALSTYELKLP